jgi:hypothetical protein
MSKEEHQKYMNWLYAIHGIKKGTSEDAPTVVREKKKD